MANSSGPRPMYRSWTRSTESTTPSTTAPRPPRQSNPLDEFYRQQDEARRQAAELQKKQEQERMRRATSMDARNYPTLSNTSCSIATPKVRGFADKAKDWAQQEEEKQLKERARRAAAEHERNMSGGVFIWHGPRHVSTEREEEEEEEEERAEVATDEWSTVERKAKKQRRERTVEEMDAYEDELREEEDKEFNGDLFDNNKHDHY